MAERLQLLGAGLIGDNAACAAVGQAELQRLRPEQGEQWYRDQTGLERRKMGDRGLRHLRQQDRQPVATRKSMGDQRIGEPIGLLAEVVERELGYSPGIGDIDQRQPASSVRVPVTGVDTHVITRWDGPGEIPVKTVVVSLPEQHKYPPGRSAPAIRLDFRAAATTASGPRRHHSR